MFRLISPRWRKGLRDLWINKFRTLLVVLAIAIGIFGLGIVANAFAILTREMNANYMGTNPASATIYTEAVDDAFIDELNARSGVAEAEARRLIVGRIQVGPDEWKNIWLYVIDDFNSVRLDTFWPEDGSYPPDSGEILIERAALSVANTQIGQDAWVKIPGQAARKLAVTGTVHAPGLAPAWMEGFAYGFITRDTLIQLGGQPILNEVKFLVAQNPMDKEAIRATTNELKSWMEQKGMPVYRIEIPDPGKHPHASQMATLLFLLEAFGVMALVLSGVLTANMISALLAGQIRQIGVMKAVGANNSQISKLYFGLVLVLGLVGLILGMPLAVLVGRGYASFASEMLNFQIFDNSIPFSYLALQVIIGLGIPLLAASWPIVRGGRITVREAISDYGIADTSIRDAGLLKLPGKFASRPFLLSLRNTFRKRGRLLLTLITLAFGGAGFIVAMNVSASMDSTVSAKFDAARYDVQIGFSRPYPTELVETTVLNVPGIEDVESWGGAKTAVVYNDDTQGNNFNLITPPAESRMMSSLPLVDGRWLQAGDENVLVVNHALLAKEPSLKAGSEVVLRINGQDSTWQVVGVLQEIMALPTAYATNEYFTTLTGLEGNAQNVVVLTKQRDAENVAAVTRQLEASLAAEGVDVATTVRLVDYRKAIEDHLLILASFLVIMSVLVLIIGGLGLISTMSINVLERTREIGVLRAIGASTRALLKIIVTEGAIIGALSWMFAVLLSWPLSKYISSTFGETFFEAPLQFAISPAGMSIWLLIAIIFAALASFYPAWSASQLTVRQTLAYE